MPTKKNSIIVTIDGSQFSFNLKQEYFSELKKCIKKEIAKNDLRLDNDDNLFYDNGDVEIRKVE
jgi:hypothetical protein